MSLYTTQTGSHFKKSLYLSLSLNYLADNAGMTLFSIKSLSLASSQTVFNPDGDPIADVVDITMRASSIGNNTVDLHFFYDPYDWSFPPDLVVRGLLATPSLSDLGLDETWNHEDPANLSKVLCKLSRIMQQGEHQRVANCENERIQIEYSCLQEMEEMDCCLIPGSDSPTKVIFAVPFDVSYSREGKRQRIKFVAKVQFSISSLVTNAVTQVQSKVEALSPFDFPDLLQSISSIGMTEQITDYIERVTDNIRSFFEKTERAKQLKKEFVNAMMDTFHNHLLEFDAVNYSFTSFIFTISKDKARQEPPSTAIATFYLSDRFPNEYPKLTLAVPMVPGSTYKPTPSPEVIPISRYSPRWGVDRIVTEIWEQLWDEIPRFHAKMTHAMSNA